MAQIPDNPSRGGQSQPTTVTIDDTLYAAQVNQRTVQDRLDQALVAMQAIIDTADLAAGTLTTLQLSNAARQLQTAVKVQARLLKNIVRYERGTFDASD